MVTQKGYFADGKPVANETRHQRVPHRPAFLGLRRLVFQLMRLLRPWVSLVAFVIIAVCTILLLFSLTFPPGTHFPDLLIIGIAFACLAMHWGYGYLMVRVLPSGSATVE